VNSITAWRITPAEHAGAVFSGEGGLYIEGRWHPIGSRMAYTSESRALAAVEVMVNVPKREQLHRHAWVIASATFSRDLLEIPPTLPADWRALPAAPSTRAFGARWLAEQRSAVLRVPSTAILGEFNFLLNPRHPAFIQITLSPPEPFHFDTRLAPS
jgi:RES domain-containing protein